MELDGTIVLCGWLKRIKDELEKVSKRTQYLLSQHSLERSKENHLQLQRGLCASHILNWEFLEYGVGAVLTFPCRMLTHSTLVYKCFSTDLSTICSGSELQWSLRIWRYKCVSKFCSHKAVHSFYPIWNTGRGIWIHYFFLDYVKLNVINIVE
jgi:hypothetical protein